MKWAKSGSKAEDIFWTKSQTNSLYWSALGESVSIGKKKFVTSKQQFILDNGMSYAAAPEKSFVHFVHAIYDQTGI